MSKFILGVTGPTGAGKTTISKIFFNYGFYVINADIIAKDIINNNVECKSEINSIFDDVFFDNGKLNKKKLANIVFNDKIALEKLNNITFKYIKSKILDIINNSENNYILLDAPLLFESELNLICNKTISVLSNLDTRRNRIINRDNISYEMANARILSQNDDEYYILRSDYIINNYNYIDINDKIKKILKTFERDGI